MPFDYDALEVRAFAEGVAEEDGRHRCMVCGEAFEDGQVYRQGEAWFEAGRAARRHVAEAHGPRLAALLEDKYLNLTPHQKKLLALMAEGRSDAEIAAETATSAATVRRQRFAFREKAKQAKLYLAAYGLAGLARAPAQAARPAAGAAGETERFLKAAFYTTEPPRLRAIPVKEKKRRAVLGFIAGQFEAGREYSEKQVNEILKAIHPEEYVTLRRYLIEYKHLARERDGSRYWVP